MVTMTDVVFSLPVVLMAIVVAFALALWPKGGWTPDEYAFAVTSVLLCLTALGAGLLLASMGHWLVELPLYLVAGFVAVVSMNAIVRTLLEARTGLVSPGSGLILHGLGHLAWQAVVWGLVGAGVFGIGLCMAVFHSTGQDVGFTLFPVAVVGLGGGGVLVLAVSRESIRSKGWGLAVVGLLGLSGSLCVGPTALQEYEIRSAVDDLPVYEGAEVRRGEIWPFDGRGDRVWELEASLPAVARFYDQALRDQGWQGHWFRLT